MIASQVGDDGPGSAIVRLSATASNWSADMPWDDSDVRRLRTLRCGHPPRVGASLAAVWPNVIGTPRQPQSPLEMALRGK